MSKGCGVLHCARRRHHYEWARCQNTIGIHFKSEDPATVYLMPDLYIWSSYFYHSPLVFHPGKYCCIFLSMTILPRKIFLPPNFLLRLWGCCFLYLSLHSAVLWNRFKTLSYLERIFNSELTFRDHVQQTCKGGSALLGFISRNHLLCILIIYT